MVGVVTHPPTGKFGKDDPLLPPGAFLAHEEGKSRRFAHTQTRPVPIKRAGGTFVQRHERGKTGVDEFRDAVARDNEHTVRMAVTDQRRGTRRRRGRGGTGRRDDKAIPLLLR